MKNKNLLVRIGDFFFKWRNFAFPLILITLFLLFSPPAQYFNIHWLEEAKDILAIIMVASGLGFRLATIGWAYIKRGGLNKQVYADTLVTEGFFNLCRNPLYVGNILIYSGIFIMHGHPVVVITGIGFYYFIYESIIAAEEFYLRNKFGDHYISYCNSVPRWVPNFSKYKASTENMTYSFKRAIMKDYSTIFNASIAIAAIELIEHFKFYPREHFYTTLYLSAAILSILLVVVLSIKFLKKTGRIKV